MSCLPVSLPREGVRAAGQLRRDAVRCSGARRCYSFTRLPSQLEGGYGWREGYAFAGLYPWTGKNLCIARGWTHRLGRRPIRMWYRNGPSFVFVLRSNSRRVRVAWGAGRGGGAVFVRKLGRNIRRRGRCCCCCYRRRHLETRTIVGAVR